MVVCAGVSCTFESRLKVDCLNRRAFSGKQDGPRPLEIR